MLLTHLSKIFRNYYNAEFHILGNSRLNANIISLTFSRKQNSILHTHWHHFFQVLSEYFLCDLPGRSSFFSDYSFAGWV